MMIKSLLAISALGALLAVGSPALADPIGPDCESCFGNIYTLSAVAVTPTDFTITYVIDTTNTTLSATDFIGQIAFKVTAQSSDITSATLTTDDTPGTWDDLKVGGLNNSGCSTGTQGFVCVTDSTNLTLTDGSKYTWVFDVQVGSASDWKLCSGCASIKANFGPANGLLMSEDITLQGNNLPEPASLLLLGAGLAGIGIWRRKVSKG